MIVHTKKKEFQEPKNIPYTEKGLTETLLFLMLLKLSYQLPNNLQKPQIGQERKIMVGLQNI